MANYILAIDQGTTGSTALVVDEQLRVVAEASEDFEQYFPQPGWVEHDADQIWASVISTVKKATASIDAKKIGAIGITNQRETVCFWEKKTTRALSRSIVWQDRRTAADCDDLKKRGLEPVFSRSTGLLLDPYFSGTKVAWALRNWGDVKSAHMNNRLCVGTIDSFLVARMTEGASHVTEPSNASRTLGFHIEKHEWDKELNEALGLPTSIWPEVRPSTSRFGVTKNFAGLPDGIPISGILGDQQAALLGQACIQEGTAKCTYGTGAFILVNTGDRIVPSQHRLLSTIAWALSEKDYTYAIEGSAFIAGAAVQWLRDGLGLIQSASEIEALAATVVDNGGVGFVPALTGMGAPYWEPGATGLLTGLTRGTTRGHIARAVLEGIALQIADLFSAMQKDANRPISRVNVDGGAAANALLMQFQSDILGVKLYRPKNLESTCLGAVFAAGLGVGIWNNLSEVAKSWQCDRVFEPQMSGEQREHAMRGWRKSVSRALLK